MKNMGTPAINSLDAKIETMAALRATLESSAFVESVKSILACTGKLVCSGIGKSGHVAGKIAATLMSTGQRACFLHPSEASHGDMGMIDPRHDMLLLISNSGATDELYPAMAYAKLHALCVILITSRPDSDLALQADIILPTPCLPEGCPIGMAPMASAVAQITIGDALAAELMVARKFSPENFCGLHHGGYLGKARQ